MLSAAQDVIRQARITEVWTALGGKELRYGRGRAFWRAGDGLNVSIDAENNLWFDHVAGEGGGVLTLIEVATGCDRQHAFCWLADFYGMPLNRPLAAAERRHSAARRENAVRAAADLIAWRRERLRALVDRLGDLYDTDRRLCNAARFVPGAADESWLWEYLHNLSIEAEQLERERDRLEAASTIELLQLRRVA